MQSDERSSAVTSQVEAGAPAVVQTPATTPNPTVSNSQNKSLQKQSEEQGALVPQVEESSSIPLKTPTATVSRVESKPVTAPLDSAPVHYFQSSDVTRNPVQPSLGLSSFVAITSPQNTFSEGNN